MIGEGADEREKIVTTNELRGEKRGRSISHKVHLAIEEWYFISSNALLREDERSRHLCAVLMWQPSLSKTFPCVQNRKGSTKGVSLQVSAKAR